MERERKIPSQTLAPTGTCCSSSSHHLTTPLERPHARTTYHSSSQISDPQKLWCDLICRISNWYNTPSNTTLDTVLKINGRRRCGIIILFNKPRTIPLPSDSLLQYRNQHTFTSEPGKTYAVNDALLPEKSGIELITSETAWLFHRSGDR